MKMVVKLITVLLVVSQLALAAENKERQYFPIPAMHYLNDHYVAEANEPGLNYGPRKYFSFNGLLSRKQDDRELQENNLPQPTVKLQQAQFRQNPFGLSNINSQVNPFAALFGSKPALVIRNPDTRAVTNMYESCQDASGVYGTCVGPFACSGLGGRVGGSCGFGSVCCISTVAKCNGQITLNNTYWVPPKTVTGGGTCGMTLTLDPNLVEQKRRICQVRLDFLAFTIAQPNTQTVCDVDNFQVAGTQNKVPVICGENSGQHMYLHAPSPSTELQLLFNLGSTNVERSWNIRISFLPCGARYLAPTECLQYFTSVAGQVTSFNWKDVPGAGNTPEYQTRQLANQNYRVCFRSETVDTRDTNLICLAVCSSKNAKPFAISEPTGKAQTETTSCQSDYLVFAGGFDPAPATVDTKNHRDRFCGERLNILADDTSNKKICSLIKPFAIHYVTNAIETTMDTGSNIDTANVGNLGFCLEYTQTF